MLVLSGKEQERFYLDLGDGRTVELVIVETERNRVRLGFVGPKTVEIYREKLWNTNHAGASPAGSGGGG